MRLLLWLILTAPIAMSQSSMAASTYRDCAGCPLMVIVPSGSFKMGSDRYELIQARSEGASENSLALQVPEHDVRVEQFSMSATEVTREQFEIFVHATNHQLKRSCTIFTHRVVRSSDHDWRSPNFVQSGAHPVVCVNWFDAKAYVRWLSQKTSKHYRLPTEAEWEYAARAGTYAPRYWGWGPSVWSGGPDNRDACRYSNQIDFDMLKKYRPGYVFPKTNQCSDGYPETAPVGTYRANQFGLFDMIGNVSEWTEDCFNPSYINAPDDGSAWNAGDCTRRVGRGGSWTHDWSSNRSRSRAGNFASESASFIGFRVARDN